MVEVGKYSLPTWLHFLPEQNLLQGVPSPDDVGQVYLQVRAEGDHGDTATDVFSITVTADTTTMSASQPLAFHRYVSDVVLLLLLLTHGGDHGRFL